MNRNMTLSLRIALAAFLAGCASPDARSLPTAIDGLIFEHGVAGEARHTSIVFHAEVSGIVPKPELCPDGAFVCGTATIDGFGNGEYAFFLQSREAADQPCLGPNGPSPAGAYVATVAFALADGSRLTLEETGTVCGPGLSLAAPGGQLSYGNPVEGQGAWRVQEATGRFSGLFSEGRCTFRNAGADFRASYAGIPPALGAP